MCGRVWVRRRLSARLLGWEMVGLGLRHAHRHAGLPGQQHTACQTSAPPAPPSATHPPVAATRPSKRGRGTRGASDVLDQPGKDLGGGRGRRGPRPQHPEEEGSEEPAGVDSDDQGPSQQEMYGAVKTRHEVGQAGPPPRGA